MTDVPRISYSLRQAAQATGVSTRTLRRCIASGDLRAFKLRKMVVIDARELERFIGACPDARPHLMSAVS